MHNLTIDMQDGFYNDTLIVTSDESELFRESNLTTRMQSNLADSKSIQLDAGRHKIHCYLLEKEVSLDIDIDLQQSLYLGLSYEPDRGLHYIIQDQPFRYI